MVILFSVVATHEWSLSCIPALNLVVITQKELTWLKWEGRYWKPQHQRSCEREARLREELEQKEALIRDLRHRLFGKKSETGGTTQAVEQQPTQALNRPRGQQRGSSGHGRTLRPDLPVVEEHHELQGDSCFCSHCGLPYISFPGDEKADIFEIDVKAYRRRVYRQRYQKSCSCPPTANNPTIIVALPPAKVIPHLGYTPLPGAQLRYFVMLDQQITVLLGFGAAAWQAAPRDNYIGWPHAHRKRHLLLVVNHARFLILPWVQVKNLASKILSMAAKQVPEDW